jgi:hypothetical protein
MPALLGAIAPLGTTCRGLLRSTTTLSGLLGRYYLDGGLCGDSNRIVRVIREEVGSERAAGWRGGRGGECLWDQPPELLHLQ